MKYGWKIIVGTIVGFLGSAFGNVGGVGGGGIFVPMLTLIIGFDAKSAIAISKCMITGGATATVFYNLRQRHPTLDLPVIDYDLALLFQPMLMLGISIGVSFNVIFPDWMLTTLLIISFTGISVKSFFKGVDTWKQETLMMKEASKNSLTDGRGGSTCIATRQLSLQNIGNPEDDAHYIKTIDPVKDNTNQSRKKVSVIDNVHWKELGLLFAVWIMILALEIGKVELHNNLLWSILGNQSTAGPHSCRNEFIPGYASIQRAENHSIKGRSTNTLASVAVNCILCLWHTCRHDCRLVRPWWRIHLGTPLPWTRNPSSGG
ncbi:hypothetical protein GLYMA_05G164600v4 [Glycine max]|nr:hypothetical protein GLYMA_05G164600v4 [Glycine max]KAH1134760.1 hypothetical protein GYH30_012873 [Glycine max]